MAIRITFQVWDNFICRLFVAVVDLGVFEGRITRASGPALAPVTEHD